MSTATKSDKAHILNVLDKDTADGARAVCERVVEVLKANSVESAGPVRDNATLLSDLRARCEAFDFESRGILTARVENAASRVI